MLVGRYVQGLYRHLKEREQLPRFVNIGLGDPHASVVRFWAFLRNMSKYGASSREWADKIVQEEMHFESRTLGSHKIKLVTD